MSTTARILDRAIALTRLGLPPVEAIEVACRRVAATDVARERARVLFVALLARAERAAA